MASSMSVSQAWCWKVFILVGLCVYRPSTGPAHYSGTGLGSWLLGGDTQTSCNYPCQADRSCLGWVAVVSGCPLGLLRYVSCLQVFWWGGLAVAFGPSLSIDQELWPSMLGLAQCPHGCVLLQDAIKFSVTFGNLSDPVETFLTEFRHS